MPSLVFISGLVGGYFGASWGRLGTKLIDFGSHFGPFLVPEAPWGPSWAMLEAILAHRGLPGGPLGPILDHF